ncbi:amyloid-beta A4 precursor protein-binding family A member 3-like [Mixophyes fleayi]|uniref:amyloid-beta A4 precursor protein-binding family A member 3-like n=1 Tax=Mixophyes fleayi TaxID=3061075 RepID=UPI003F4D9095
MYQRLQFHHKRNIRGKKRLRGGNRVNGDRNPEMIHTSTKMTIPEKEEGNLSRLTLNPKIHFSDDSAYRQPVIPMRQLSGTSLGLPGPCEPEDLLDGVVFGAKYLGSTQLQCERHQMPSTRMQQAQEAVDRVKAPAGESQPTTEVDVMVSTQCVKVLIADSQEAVMEHQLQTISYTADIDSIVVIMARRKSPRSLDQSSCHKRPHKMLCHVFQSVDVSPLLGVIKKKKWAC